MLLYFVSFLVLGLIFYLTFQVVRVVLSNRYHRIRLKRAEKCQNVQQDKAAEGKKEYTFEGGKVRLFARDYLEALEIFQKKKESS